MKLVPIEFRKSATLYRTLPISVSALHQNKDCNSKAFLNSFIKETASSPKVVARQVCPLPPFNSKIHLKDITAAFLIQKLVELPEVHVVPSAPMWVKHCLLKTGEFAQGVDSFSSPAPLARTEGNVLSVSNHDLLPSQNLHSAK